MLIVWGCKCCHGDALGGGAICEPRTTLFHVVPYMEMRVDKLWCVCVCVCVCVPHSKASANLVRYSEEILNSLLKDSASGPVCNSPPVEFYHPSIHPGETIAL